MSGKSSLIFLVGPSGSGKTIIGRNVAAMLGVTFIDTDKRILEKTGLTYITDVFSVHGELRFRELEREILDEILEDDTPAMISTGGGLPANEYKPPIDNSGNSGAKQDQAKHYMMDVMNNHKTIYLKASIESLWSRLNFDPELEDRPLLKEGKEEALRKLVENRKEFYDKASITIKTDSKNVKKVTEELFKVITE